MNCSTPGLPVHHQLLEATQTHVHWVRDAIQPSHPLLSPSPPALNFSQHEGLFKWVSSLHQVPKVLEFQLQHQSFHLLPHSNISKLTDFTPSPPQPLWPKTPFSLVLNYYNRLLTGLPASTLTLPQPICHDSQNDIKKKNQIMSVTCLKHSKNFSLHSEWDLTPYPSLQGHTQAASTCSPDSLSPFTVIQLHSTLCSFLSMICSFTTFALAVSFHLGGPHPISMHGFHLAIIQNLAF